MAKKATEEEALTPQQEKMKALMAAMSKIEKDYGKGSIMRMGDEQIDNVEVIPTGSISLNAALGVGGYPRDVSLRSMVLSHLVKPLWPSMPSQRPRRQVVSLHSSMLSMHSTVSMLPTLVLILKTSISLSQIMVSRHLRLLISLSAQALSTSSLSTL